MSYQVPLSAGDLKEVGKHLGQWERRLISKSGDYTQASALVSRIEVFRPDDTEVIGHFVLEDGWVGFQPLDGSDA